VTVWESRRSDGGRIDVGPGQQEVRLQNGELTGWTLAAPREWEPPPASATAWRFNLSCGARAFRRPLSGSRAPAG